MAFFVYSSQYRTYLKPGYIFRLKEMAGSEGDNSLVTSFTNLPIACGKVKQTTFKQEKKKINPWNSSKSTTVLRWEYWKILRENYLKDDIMENKDSKDHLPMLKREK